MPRGGVDTGGRLSEVQRATHQEGDRAEQGAAGAVERQAGNAARGEPEVGRDEEGEREEREVTHRVPMASPLAGSAAGAAQAAGSGRSARRSSAAPDGPAVLGGLHRLEKRIIATRAAREKPWQRGVVS